MANLCDTHFFNLFVFNRKHMFEIFKDSSWKRKNKIRKDEKTRQWWITKRKEKKDQMWGRRNKFLKAVNAPLRAVNDVCLAIINDACYAIAINDAWVLITFGTKLWSALGSYVCLNSFGDVAIKSFSFAVAKCIIDAIVISLVINDAATKSIN